MATILDVAEEVRWVGVTPPTGEDVERAERYTDFAARDLADAVVADLDDFEREWRRDYYVRNRDEERRLREIYTRMWKSGRFAGWVVRDDVAA
jgi:hypothetical protein